MGQRGVLAGRAVYGLSDAELAAAAVEITGVVRVLSAELLAVVGEQAGRNIPRQRGFASVGTWLNSVLKVGVDQASQMAKLVKLLPDTPGVADALGAGQISQAQAMEIARAVQTFTGGVKAQAVETLLSQAAVLRPEELRVAGRRVLRHVDPDAAEEFERKALERQEKQALDSRSFTLSSDGGGRFRFSGYTGAVGAAVIRSALDPLSNPARYRRPAAEGDAGSSGDGRRGREDAAGERLSALFGGGVDGLFAGEDRGLFGEGDDGGQRLPQAFKDPRTAPQRRHDALLEVFGLALATEDLPDNGGCKAQVTVTMPLDTLTGQVQAGTLDTGEQLSPEAVRRMACDAGIIPAILNGHGVPLDLGRERRLITGALRRALVLRDKGCAYPGCDRPPKWCQGHHRIHWTDGGTTCLANSVLLCWFHHNLAHDGGWTIVMAPDGIPEFIPPAWLDPQQIPQRNLYHRRT